MRSDMPIELQAYLRRAMAQPFSRPEHDCCFTCVNWIVERTGIDPAPHLRGAYKDARGAARIIRAHGGFLPMWRTCMAAAGFQETANPQMGDVGVVVDAIGQEVAVIRIRGAWAGKTTRGIQIEDFPMLAAWSLARG